MSFKPEDLYLNVQDFFGALLPGAVATGVLLYALHDSELARYYKELSPTAQWAAFGVVSLFLGWLAYMPAHIFNRIYDATYRRWRRRHGDALLEYATRQTAREIPNGNPGSVYDYVRNWVADRDTRVAGEVQAIQGISKMFRTMCLYLLVAVVVLATRRQWQFCATAFVALILSFLVFCERRFAGSTRVYQRFRDIRESDSGLARVVAPGRD